jgi:tetratricopeptide (TPR) repeat protein
LNLTITYNEMGRTDLAEEVFTGATKIARSEPKSLDPFVAGKLANEHFKLGNLYIEFSLYDEAVEEFRKAVRLRPGLADVHTRLGVALREKGLYSEAIEQFTLAKEANPYYGPAFVQLGITYRMQGHPGLALEEWERALENNPNLKEARTFIRILKREG